MAREGRCSGAAMERQWNGDGVSDPRGKKKKKNKKKEKERRPYQYLPSDTCGTGTAEGHPSPHHQKPPKQQQQQQQQQHSRRRKRASGAQCDTRLPLYKIK